METLVFNVRSPQRDPMILAFDLENCKGCGFCVEYCPKHVLSLATGRCNAEGHQVVQAERAENCRACGLCELYCPDHAISLRHPVAQ